MILNTTRGSWRWKAHYTRMTRENCLFQCECLSLAISSFPPEPKMRVRLQKGACSFSFVILHVFLQRWVFEGCIKQGGWSLRSLSLSNLGRSFAKENGQREWCTCHGRSWIFFLLILHWQSLCLCNANKQYPHLTLCRSFGSSLPVFGWPKKRVFILLCLYNHHNHQKQQVCTDVLYVFVPVCAECLQHFCYLGTW